MKYIYPTLEIEMYKKGIRLKSIASFLGISTKALGNKLRGNTSFTWPEACSLQKEFFPELSKDTLFEKLQKTA